MVQQVGNHGHVWSSWRRDSPILRKLPGWVATIPRTRVDLCKSCISYRYAGAMGLPREIVEKILRLLRDDITALKACSLTCRALFSVTREMIHRRVRLATWKVYHTSGLADRIAAKVLRGGKDREAHMRYLSIAGKRGLLGFARELIINIGPNFTPRALEVYLPHFLLFSKVRALTIYDFDIESFLPNFERYFARFVPTVRSLHLPDVVGGIHEIQEFIHKFPHLDDLSLTLSSCYSVDAPAKSPVEPSPPLKGKLILRGPGMVPVRFLLEVPGGIHFRSIDVGGVDKVDLDEILAACSHTLEVFAFRPRSLFETVDLSQNLALTRFEARVDPDDLDLIPPLLHETLLTIKSSAFSEFILKLEGLPVNHRFYELSVGTVWGDDWWIIDRDLNKMVATTGRDIKFVVQVGGFGGVWGTELQGFLGDVFPLMNARGLVRAPRPSSNREGERIIW